MAIVERAAAHNPLLQVENARKHFITKRTLLEKTLVKANDVVVKAVDGVDLEIYPGEIVGLVGKAAAANQPSVG